jgi:hypothetical protein
LHPEFGRRGPTRERRNLSRQCHAITLLADHSRRFGA